MKITVAASTCALSILGGAGLFMLAAFAAATEREMFDEYARFPVMLYGGLFLTLPAPLLVIGGVYAVRSISYWFIALGLTLLLGLAVTILLIDLQW